MRPFLTFILLWLPFLLMAKLPGTANLQPKSSLAFLENKGQITDQYYHLRKDIDFKLNAPDLDIFIGDGQIHYQWTKMTATPEGEFANNMSSLSGEDRRGQQFETYRMDVALLNANKEAEVITEEAQDYYENYYLPSCPDGATAHSFKKITYKNIYPNIDWVLYTNGKSLKYDFIVRPGGNPRDIQIQYNGATALALDNGALTATTPFGSITENKPYTYEAGTRKEVVSKFIMKDNILTFDVSAYTGTVVIDPQLEWATYYSSADVSLLSFFYSFSSLVADEQGNIYLIARTKLTNAIITSGAYQVALAGNIDGYLSKISGNGTVVWATYYGGNGNDEFQSGKFYGDCIYVTGGSNSDGLATGGTYQVQRNNSATRANSDGLIVKFNINGQRVWATYYGGADSDRFYSIDYLDGSIYLAGETNSQSGIATPGAHQVSYGACFILKMDTLGKNRKWATYYCKTPGYTLLGNSALKTSSNSIFYFAGITADTINIATPGSHLDKKPNYQQFVPFLVKFDSSGRRIWGTYYGGVPWRQLNGPGNAIYGIAGITLDGQDNVYMAGGTGDTSGIATPGAFKETHDSLNAGFVVKFDSAGKRQWGTYLGEGLRDYSTSVVIDKNNDVNIVGSTSSVTGIATAGGWHTRPDSSTGNFISDGYFMKFDRNGNRLWGTYYGGENRDALTYIVTNSSGNIYLLGGTQSKNNIAWPSGVLQDSLGQVEDAFIIKANPDSIVYLEPVDSVLCINSTGGHVRIGYIVSRSFRAGNVFTVQLSGANGSFVSPTIIGSKPSTYSGYIDCVIPVATPRTKGYRIRVVASTPFYISNDNGIDIELKDGPAKPIATGDTLLCSNEVLHLSATCATPGVSFTWSGPNNFTASTANITRSGLSKLDSGLYIVTVSPPECKTRDTVLAKIFRAPNKPTITHNAPICEGDTLVFSYQADKDSGTFYTIGWPNIHAILGQNSLVDSATQDFTGEYIVVANNHGCISRDTTFIYIKPKPAPVLTYNNPLYAGQDLQLKAAVDSASFAWEGPDGFSSNLQNPRVPDVTSYNSGTYTVTTTRDGCTAITDIIVEVKDLDDDFFVLFPNPNDGRFTIKGNLKSDQTIQMVVVNDIGQQIYTDKVKSSKKLINHSVTLPAVANGVYMLHLRANGKKKVIPFTVGK